jgi:hypothetical protein
LAKRDKRPTKEEQLAAQAPDRERHDEPNLSEAEREEILQFADRTRNCRRAPKAQVRSKPGKPLSISFPSLVEIARFMSVFGTAEPALADLMLYGIVNAACEGTPDNPPSEQDINQALAAVTGIDAKDGTEAMLATQMTATHVAAIRALRHLKASETIPQYNCNGNLAVKLLRTFTMQVEALQRYRGKGQQKVTVEHVHVHAGGQAIVGAISPRGGDKEKSDAQAHAPSEITHEPGTPMSPRIAQNAHSGVSPLMVGANATRRRSAPLGVRSGERGPTAPAADLAGGILRRRREANALPPGSALRPSGTTDRDRRRYSAM